jgi:hypothetical protein
VLLVSIAIFLAAGLLFIPRPTEVKGMTLIGELQNDKTPTISLEVTIVRETPAVPGDVSQSLLVEINNTVTEPKNLEIKN